jgi:hypothetical protein
MEEKYLKIRFSRRVGDYHPYRPFVKVFYSADDVVRFILKYRLPTCGCEGDEEMSKAVVAKLSGVFGSRKELMDYLLLGKFPENF